jgi:hypothetical protein
MAEPTERSTAVAEPGADPVYRPLSILALVGFGLAVLYAAIVGGGGLVAFRSGSPLLLGTLMGVMLPLAAFLVSALGRWQIARSEGTRAGLPLARWGMWLSVLIGLGYLAFYAATYFAIRSDANEYTLRWFDMLRRGKFNQAFLHVMEPNVRASVNPDDEKQMEIRFNPNMAQGRPGPLMVFRTSELVRLFQFGGQDTDVKPLGVREWEYNNGKYRIKRIYEISSPEGSVEVAAVVTGSASTKGEFEGREWQVSLMDTNIAKRKTTPKGEVAGYLRVQSATFITRWGQKVDEGNLEEAALDLFEPSERPRRKAVYDARAVLLTGLALPTAGDGAVPASVLGRAAAWADRASMLQAYMPDLKSVTENLIQLDPKKPFAGDDEDVRKGCLAGVHALLQPGRSKNQFRGLFTNQLALPPRPVDLPGDRAQFTHEFQFAFAPRFQLAAKVTVVSAEGANHLEYQGGWRLVSIEPVEAQDMRKPRLRQIPNRPEPSFKSFPIDPNKPWDDPAKGKKGP